MQVRKRMLFGGLKERQERRIYKKGTKGVAKGGKEGMSRNLKRGSL
jgi:hypothetical protein